ncbi:glucan 1,3-beta-glucosidase, putative [Phytophthora infestans T30-4]|uniref:Glucan 1,3-beta-glucosidase, putative n=1 Tax=Phytophthora infestans (strain T30-4) TaxID=403677 RepID=D0NEL8_PHYIT|nr:glucan 1,3-beta-glucosidase, putative [Phytophthora infestans T30-4]EEY56663.1 glucan 1,3-beta-glucosidase, putative [Phytophthora infestans T30-4]|eukprot:XP_002902737.1 glucan 1,3-beta-glucosidase, putative [Phytophthora infestans T30-4]
MMKTGSLSWLECKREHFRHKQRTPHSAPAQASDVSVVAMKVLLQVAAALSWLSMAATAIKPVEHVLDTMLRGNNDSLPGIKDAKWYWENDHEFTSENLEFFENFKPHDENQTCSSDRHATPFNKQVRGANLGGCTQERFGDKAPEKTAMDMYTFCTALGKEEANRQLRIHWATWVTEADLKEMAEAGVNSLRVPVGDWMFIPYEPYIGCTDGAVNELDRVANLAYKYNIDLLLDIHGLVDYYWKSYKRVKARAPPGKFVLHDSFRFGVQYWSQFMRGCPDIALDTHIYQAWNAPGTRSDYFSNACQQKYMIADMENAMMPVIVGEWSLGTDNCAMWLNGFNDNLPGFPNIQCRMTQCPVHSTYLGQGFPGTPLDITRPIQGPYGTGQSGPSFGKCPITSNTSFGQQDDTDEREFTRNLNMKKLNAFAVGHGWYFWNFKTEFGSRWNFLELVRKSAFPKNVSNYRSDEEVFSACLAEDKGAFVCAAKRGVHRSDLESGLDFACGGDDGKVDCTDIDKRFTTIEERCDWAFNEYWHAHREEGATCDFGGAAHLMTIPSPSSVERQEFLTASVTLTVGTLTTIMDADCWVQYRSTWWAKLDNTYALASLAARRVSRSEVLSKYG